MTRIGLYTLFIAALFTATASAADRPESIRWVDFSRGQVQSRQTGKPMMIYFYSKTCPSCTEMKKKTWKDPRIIDLLNTRYTPIKVNVESEKQVAAMYKVYYLPTTWFVKPDGQPLGNRVGFIPPDLLLKIFKHLSW